MDTEERKSEVHGKCLNVVLEKAGEDQLDRSAENERVLHRITAKRNIRPAIKYINAN